MATNEEIPNDNVDDKIDNKIDDKIDDNVDDNVDNNDDNANMETIVIENEQLKKENGELIIKLKKKDKEIFNLEEALTTLHEELKFLESKEVQSVAKDLAKKNRKLTVQLERERTRCGQLNLDIDRLKSELETFSHHNLSPKKIVEPLSFSKRPSDNIISSKSDQSVSSKKEELLQQKLNKIRDELSGHKEIIKKLKNIIKKEIGNNKMDLSLTKINEMIRDNSSWKGRAEKIAILQNKLSEKKREIELLNDINNIGIKKNKNLNKNDEHILKIGQISTERMKKYENAQLEIENLNKLNNELGETLKYKTSRIRGLEINTSKLKKKLDFFVDKSKTDDSLIETLQNQLNEQLKLENSLNKKEKLLNKNNTEIITFKKEIDKQNKKMSILNETIDSMKDKILNLTQERTNIFKEMFENFNNDNKLYQIKLLKIENNKQKDIILSYKKNLNNLQKKLSRKSSPRDDNNLDSISSSKLLKEKLKTLNQEQQLIKASYLSIIQSKEIEIQSLQSMLKEIQTLHENSITQLTKQLKQIKLDLFIV